MSQENNYDRALDLIINDNDVSEYVGHWFTCEENIAGWTVHTELVSNEVTSTTLRPLTDKHVQVRYRMLPKGSIGPWRSGRAVISWRFTEAGSEELILYGTGRLDMDKSSIKTTGSPITATIAKTTLLGGKLVKGEEVVGTIEIVQQEPQEKSVREAQLRLAEDAEVQAITRPEFVLFLANSTLSSYRSLRVTGESQQNGEFFYSSLILLPLATEYFLKYLLCKDIGELKREYHNHRLLALYDCLPFDLQRAIGDEFQNELEDIGRGKTSQNLRVFLMKSQNAFTVVRYLFEDRHAKAYRHLINPEHISILTCVLNALERVSKRS